MFDWYKKRKDIKNFVIERERAFALRERLNLIKNHEKSLKNQAENLKKEFQKELNNKINVKNDEIENLKNLIRNIKFSGENLQILSNEFELELRGLILIIGKMQNRFSNIEDRAFRETKKIDKKINRMISEEL